MENAKLKTRPLAALFAAMLLAVYTHFFNAHTIDVRQVDRSLVDAPQTVTLILQTNTSNCGLASLAMLLSYYLEKPVSLASLERAATILLNASSEKWKTAGYSVEELQFLASAYGISIRADRIGAAELQSLTFPLLAWIDFGSNGHFTVVQSLDHSEASLADPTRGYLRLGKATWDRLWLTGPTGIVLFVEGLTHR